MKHILKSKTGMTLIEVMTTAVIIGIIASMAVPRFNYAFDRVRFRSSNRDLVSTIRLARSKAITDKAQYGIHTEGDDLTITLFKDIISPNMYTFDPGDSILKIDTLPDEFTYLGTDITGNTVVFTPNGSAKFTGNGNITTMASSSGLVAIATHNILASTGRVQSQSSYY